MLTNVQAYADQRAAVHPESIWLQCSVKRRSPMAASGQLLFAMPQTMSLGSLIRNVGFLFGGANIHRA